MKKQLQQPIKCPKCGFLLLSPAIPETSTDNLIELFPVSLRVKVKKLLKVAKILNMPDSDLHPILVKMLGYPTISVRRGIQIYLKEEYWKNGIGISYCLGIIRGWNTAKELKFTGGHERLPRSV